jgi:hypothetical protein
MADISGLVQSGNYSGQTVSLTGDTTVTGGNFVEARITSNGFALDRQGGNWRGWWLDGVKQDSWTRPANYIADALVVELHAKFMDTAQKDIMAALEWLVTYVKVTNPGATQTTARTAWNTYAASTNPKNIIAFDYCVEWFVKNYLPAGQQTWAGLKTLINSKSIEAWRGEEVLLG